MKTQTPKSLGITPTQFRNIAILSLGVRYSVPPPKFDISDFNCDSRNSFTLQEAKYECGTTACFLGYGPLLKIKPKQNEDWFGYCTRTISNRLERLYVTDCSDIYNMLFDASHRNCPVAAARRGAYLLLNGIPDEANLWQLSDWEAPKNFKPHWNVIRQIAECKNLNLLKNGVTYKKH